MNQLWNLKNTAIIEEVFHPDAVIHSTLGQKSKPEEMQEIVKKWLIAIPDIQVDILHLNENQELVTTHWKARGTHQHELMGIPSKGNPVEYQGATLYQFKEGKVVEYWAYLDVLTLQSQMEK